MAEKKTFYLGTGRRKTAVARVRLCEGKGKIEINGRTLDNYFTEEKDRGAVLGPLQVTEQFNRVDVIVKVHGGGITGQAGAICQGVARAIKTMFAPPVERKSVTIGGITMVRARRVETKTVPGAVVPTPSVDGAAGEEAGGGMQKKLRDSGYLTRDSRMKERKKYGLRGARRGTQFSKR
ncbi:30S ribosomal protein S9 [Fimbriiglobus ruber]|uniref:Small ribosomal subunit protein uS9 n=1 Tax=Fimbriiglobus ruber TaxID=1908690 RepID=A0A225DZD7_9BACT|nr:30S ribosomal protein S9 [Fimbriiglobus ruber]OWK46662.1 SSU ribosomal protein S9p (S16e) [Fimbriiglobus ruber]